tara:strand:- start:1071 stop:1259 length:189 start_codon:yes stop_codon:yes gene_type:complete
VNIQKFIDLQKFANVHELTNLDEISVIFLLISPYFSYLLFGVLFMAFAFKLSYYQKRRYNDA